MFQVQIGSSSSTKVSYRFLVCETDRVGFGSDNTDPDIVEI